MLTNAKNCKKLKPIFFEEIEIVRFWQSRLKVVKNHKRLEWENEQDMQDKDLIKAQGIARDVHLAQWY